MLLRQHPDNPQVLLTGPAKSVIPTLDTRDVNIGDVRRIVLERHIEGLMSEQSCAPYWRGKTLEAAIVLLGPRTECAALNGLVPPSDFAKQVPVLLPVGAHSFAYLWATVTAHVTRNDILGLFRGFCFTAETLPRSADALRSLKFLQLAVEQLHTERGSDMGKQKKLTVISSASSHGEAKPSVPLGSRLVLVWNWDRCNVMKRNRKGLEQQTFATLRRVSNLIQDISEGANLRIEFTVEKYHAGGSELELVKVIPQADRVFAINRGIHVRVWIKGNLSLYGWVSSQDLTQVELIKRIFEYEHVAKTSSPSLLSAHDMSEGSANKDASVLDVPQQVLDLTKKEPASSTHMPTVHVAEMQQTSDIGRTHTSIAHPTEQNNMCIPRWRHGALDTRTPLQVLRSHNYNYSDEKILRVKKTLSYILTAYGVGIKYDDPYPYAQVSVENISVAILTESGLGRNKVETYQGIISSWYRHCLSLFATKVSPEKAAPWNIHVKLVLDFVGGKDEMYALARARKDEVAEQEREAAKPQTSDATDLVDSIDKQADVSTILMLLEQVTATRDGLIGHLEVAQANVNASEQMVERAEEEYQKALANKHNSLIALSAARGELTRVQGEVARFTVSTEVLARVQSLRANLQESVASKRAALDLQAAELARQRALLNAEAAELEKADMALRGLGLDT